MNLACRCMQIVHQIHTQEKKLRRGKCAFHSGRLCASSDAVTCKGRNFRKRLTWNASRVSRRMHTRVCVWNSSFSDTHSQQLGRLLYVLFLFARSAASNAQLDLDFFSSRVSSATATSPTAGACPPGLPTQLFQFEGFQQVTEADEGPVGIFETRCIWAEQNNTRNHLMSV